MLYYISFGGEYKCRTVIRDDTTGERFPCIIKSDHGYDLTDHIFEIKDVLIRIE